MAIPKTLLPLLSSSLNVGVALGGYATTVPFLNPDFSGLAIAAWFKDFFRPGFVIVTTLGATSLGSGLWAAWTSSRRGTIQGHAASSCWTLAGVVFTILHFAFGNTVLSIMDRITSEPELAQSQMTKWIWLHITRTLVADIPAWIFFLIGIPGLDRSRVTSDLSFEAELKMLMLTCYDSNITCYATMVAF
ncbi:hypothetical protein F53441_10678 [Fusarium austroafricanum]|uniref:Uncharacterized protein n=1 Tax=Fusarium austroafricanum TaxID=2364996 RepID=A0A8H4KAU9_9HYPO|nr:hypothetical protein F53441_10678 [Fusarium austroafricanum]